VGISTWLHRYDARAFERAMKSYVGPGLVRDLSSRREDPEQAAAFGRVAGICTGRAWHALHVALTGEVEGGAPPRSHVVWGAVGPTITMTAAFTIHTPETVHEVAEYLRRTTVDHAINELYAAVELGLYVYSFENWGEAGEDIVESGLLGRVFETVVCFYAAAAAHGQFVVLHRG
jgi:hypothetical protein